jgi:protein-tyrosine-phosphatase
MALLLSSGAVAAAEHDAPPSRKDSRTVVFVCEHGSVKSLIAREWFNKRAGERGVGLRAVSRGLMPETRVPPAIVDALRNDGFDVSAFEPRAFSTADASAALRVVGIGVDLSSSAARGKAPLETWEGIPPASESYLASRDALLARVEALLSALSAERHPR